MRKDDKLIENGIERHRKKIILNGTENWTKRTEYANNVVFTILNTMKTANAMSNMFKWDRYSYASDVANKMGTDSSMSFLSFNVPKSIATTVEEWKAFLAQKNAENIPLMVEYESAIETETYTAEQQAFYDSIQKLKLNKGTNNIFCTEEVGPNMNLKYTKSTEIVIQKIEQAITAIGGV